MLRTAAAFGSPVTAAGGGAATTGSAGCRTGAGDAGLDSGVGSGAAFGLTAPIGWLRSWLRRRCGSTIGL